MSISGNPYLQIEDRSNTEKYPSNADQRLNSIIEQTKALISEKMKESQLDPLEASEILSEARAFLTVPDIEALLKRSEIELSSEIIQSASLDDIGNKEKARVEEGIKEHLGLLALMSKSLPEDQRIAILSHPMRDRYEIIKASLQSLNRVVHPDTCFMNKPGKALKKQLDSANKEAKPEILAEIEEYKRRLTEYSKNIQPLQESLQAVLVDNIFNYLEQINSLVSSDEKYFQQCLALVKQANSNITKKSHAEQASIIIATIEGLKTLNQAQKTRLIALVNKTPAAAQQGGKKKDDAKTPKNSSSKPLTQPVSSSESQTKTASTAQTTASAGTSTSTPNLVDSDEVDLDAMQDEEIPPQTPDSLLESISEIDKTEIITNAQGLKAKFESYDSWSRLSRTGFTDVSKAQLISAQIILHIEDLLTDLFEDTNIEASTENIQALAKKLYKDELVIN